MAELLNNELSIIIPEGFRIMSQQEIRELNYENNPPQFCMRDEERHVIFSIAWKKTNPLVGALLSVSEIAGSMEKGMAAPMAKFDYELEGYTSRKIGGRDSTGFGYNYTVEDVGMHGAAYSVKTRKTFYYIYAYVRQAAREEGLELISQILDGISWK